MTPLKFRAWHKAEKIMLPHVGRLGFGIGDALASVDAGQTDNWIRDGYHTFRGKEELEMIVLMQSTGLKDQNDVEIFEGDIVEYRTSTLSEERAIKAVKWHVEETYSGWNISRAYQNVCKVIGNIYSNPELLPKAA